MAVRNIAIGMLVAVREAYSLADAEVEPHCAITSKMRLSVDA